jgi:hypothetical protein
MGIDLRTSDGTAEVVMSYPPVNAPALLTRCR